MSFRFRGWKKTLISWEINKDGKRERERKWVRARRKEHLHVDSRRGDTSAQTELSPKGMVVRSGMETSIATSSAIFFWLMLFRLFLVLQILSLTVSLSLCFTLLWDCVGLRKHKVPLLNEKNTQFYSLKYNLK